MSKNVLSHDAEITGPETKIEVVIDEGCLSEKMKDCCVMIHIYDIWEHGYYRLSLSVGSLSINQELLIRSLDDPPSRRICVKDVGTPALQLQTWSYR